ncbi:VanW family protein [Nocardioides sp.]|uniref:VanW family protein n=1 Tax=Nocardioides sp. TaxID=35761 RepID=UPI0035659AC5
MKSEREGGRAVLFVLLGLGLLFAGGYAAAYVAAGDKVPRGTTVAGVDIGGRTQASAVEALEDGLAARVAEPVIVTVDAESREFAPEDLGLSVDYQASVEAAGGERSLDPQRLWDYYTDGEDLAPVVEVDDSLLGPVLDDLEAEFGAEPRDGAISFATGKAIVTNPVTGASIDREAASDSLAAQWLVDEDDPTSVALDLAEVLPEIDDADVIEAMRGFANPALAGPVALVFGDSPVELAPSEFAPVLRLDAVDGALVPGLNTKALIALVEDAITSEAPEDATVALVDGRPKVVPAKPGVSYRRKDVTSAFLELVQRTEGERSVSVDAKVAEPDFTTKDARALKIREKVSSFTTYYPPATYRDINIGRAAEIVDGTVLKPGETFSLNGIVGERTAENGFTEGFIISNGILKEDLGGGVSQMATTLYNAAFFAGLEDVEHKAHSFYIDRYPVGREATVAWGAVDLRFKNNTPYGVLVDAKVIKSAGRSQGTVTVNMWSTEYWDISSSTGDRYKFTSPKTRRLKGDDCVPNKGYGGFDIDVKRFVRKVGDPTLIRTENIHTTYIPSDTVICEN